MAERTIRELMYDFLDEMIMEFERHNSHSEYQNDFDVDGSFDNLKHTDIPTLRYEKHAHYAKWMYNGVHKKTFPETTTLINDTNVNFLLWVKLRLENPQPKQDGEQ